MANWPSIALMFARAHLLPGRAGLSPLPTASSPPKSRTSHRAIVIPLLPPKPESAVIDLFFQFRRLRSIGEMADRRMTKVGWHTFGAIYRARVLIEASSIAKDLSAYIVESDQ